MIADKANVLFVILSNMNFIHSKNSFDTPLLHSLGIRRWTLLSGFAAHKLLVMVIYKAPGYGNI